MHEAMHEPSRGRPFCYGGHRCYGGHKSRLVLCTIPLLDRVGDAHPEARHQRDVHWAQILSNSEALSLSLSESLAHPEARYQRDVHWVLWRTQIQRWVDAYESAAR